MVRTVLTLKTVGVLAMAFAFWALPTKAMAVPVACGGGVSVATYTDGCFIDGLLFSNFIVEDAGNPGSEVVNAVSTAVIGSTIFFELNPNFGLEAQQDIHFLFRVSTLDGSANIIGVDLSVNGVGQTSISELLCTAQFVAGACLPINGGSLIGTGLVAFPGVPDNEFFSAVSSAWVQKDIFKAAGTGNHLTSFTQSFHVPDGGSTVALLGLGLLGLRTLRRRFSRR